MFSIEIRIIFLFLFVNCVESLRCHVAYPLNCIYNSTCSYRSIECQQSSSPSLNRGGMYCTTIIKKEDEQFLIGRMDCMYDQETTKTCLNQSQCFMKYTNDQKQFLHCCCDQHLCNLNFNLSDPEPVQIPSNEYRTNFCQNRFCKKMYLFIGLIVGLCFVICLIFFGLFCRKNFIGNLKKCRKTHENHQVEIDPLINDRFQIDSNQIQIINLYKKGRFSYLEKGFYQNQEIILKTFSNDRQSESLFENEKTIYSLISNEKHKNILQYFGFTKSPINRLIFEFCRNGSLKDYLIGNQIENEIDLLLMLKDLSEGLHYLHRDYRNEYPRRAPIAHRDFKSENILFFHFNRLVICDFAMSTQIQQYQYGLNNQQQMGTPRYMSPEILVGTIGCDEGSLLKCDVYALGIVFWEILSRFNFQNSHVNKNYEFPFEIQLKENHFNVNNPTVKEMNIIIELSPPLNRPLIDSNWNNSKMKSFHSIISIINECWNQNPELRITAGVVFSRINKIFEEISSI